MSFLKNLFGGAIIIAIATVIGVAQNSARSKPVTLFPKVAKKIARTADTSQPSEKTSARSPGVASAGETKKGRTAGEAEVSSGPVTDNEYAAGELGKDRLRALLEAGSIVLIDARSAHEFEEGHLPGAINIPFDNFVDYYNDLVDLVPMDADVVAYCRSVTCDLSDNLAQELQLAGYERVLVYRGGWQEWTEAAYPTEGSE